MADSNPGLENDLTKLIEDIFVVRKDTLFSPRSLASQLVQEITATTRRKKQPAERFAPDQYTLSIHPDDISLLIPNVSHTQSIFSERLQIVLEKNGYSLAREPHITLATDPTLGRSQQRVIAWHSSDPLQFTAGDAPQEMVDHRQPPENAFLIVNGKHRFSLNRDNFTIGRRLDNHLILEDLHVSRRHARIEMEAGHYFISDCESTAGTFVNNRQVKRSRLHPGDQIRICDYLLIYGEGTGAPDLQPPSDLAVESAGSSLGVPTTPGIPDILYAGTRPIKEDNYHATNQITHPGSLKLPESREKSSKSTEDAPD